MNDSGSRPLMMCYQRNGLPARARTKPLFSPCDSSKCGKVQDAAEKLRDSCR
jgi:hypothetical protein